MSGQGNAVIYVGDVADDWSGDVSAESVVLQATTPDEVRSHLANDDVARVVCADGLSEPTVESVLSVVEAHDSDLPVVFTTAESAAAASSGEVDRYRALLDAIEDPLFVLDSAGVVLVANEALATEFGDSPEEIVGEPIQSFVGAGEFERIREKASKIRESGHERVTFDLSGGTEDRYESIYEVTITQLGVGEDSIAGIVRDVTEQRRQERDLGELNRKVEELHDIATELQACKTEQEIYDLTVQASSDILEFDWCSVSMVEDGWFEFKAASESAPVEVGQQRLRVDEGAAGRALERGESSVTGNAQADDVSSPVDPAIKSGLTVPIGDMGVLEGLSHERYFFDAEDVELAELLAANLREALVRVRREQRLREQQRELERQNEQLEQFAHVVSHDLRNPMSVVKGQVEVAQEQLDEENPHLALALEAVDRMAELVDDILTLARKGKQIDELETVSLDSVVTDAWETLEGGEATLDVVDQLGTAMSDPGRLYEVFANLFRNAMEHGRSDVTIRVGRLDDGFYVEDDGPGIPAEERERIFESGYTTSDEGTGFGLTIVSEIAKAHGWTVELAAAESAGARFEFRGVEFAS